jgi:hypothetical protein
VAELELVQVQELLLVPSHVVFSRVRASASRLKRGFNTLLAADSPAIQ